MGGGRSKEAVEKTRRGDDRSGTRGPITPVCRHTSVIRAPERHLGPYPDQMFRRRSK